jgi:hypothetical protein
MALLSYRRHRFPREIIQHAIWLYLRFTLSYRDVEELLAERPQEQSGGKFASSRATTRAQAAAVQVGSIRPALPRHARRHSQYLQSATPPHLPIHTAHLPRRSYRTVAKCCRSGMTLASVALNACSLALT